MKFAYIHIPNDVQGPNVLLCEACIRADGHEAEDWFEDDDVRCACCGSTAENDAWPPKEISTPEVLAKILDVGPRMYSVGARCFATAAEATAYAERRKARGETS